VLGYRSLDAEYYTVGVGGNACAYTLVHYQPNIGWGYPIAFAGTEDHLKAGQPYKVAVRIQGQKITLSDDDIPVFEHVLQWPLPKGQLGLFAWGTNRVEFTESRTGNCVCEDGPHHETAAREAEIKSELRD
jgi:hypothetical protein